MIRAIFFDFYSVWAPDRFSEYIAEAAGQNPAVAAELADALQSYYFGTIDTAQLVDTFRYKLNRPDIDPSLLSLQENDIAPGLVEFLRELHGHFLKLGVLANLGSQEYALLKSFNDHNQLLEVISGPLAQAMPLPLLSQEVFANALQAIGEPPKSTLVVSGHDDYLQFAASLGLQTIKFEGFPKLKETLERLLASESPGA